ncbi:hypothetical protein ES702_05211 [subsurface metagenome]
MWICYRFRGNVFLFEKIIMKKKTRNITADIIDIIGYMSAIGQIVVLAKILYDIDKYGKAIAREPNPIILKFEIILAGTTIIFLIYKLIKGIENRWI